MSGSGQITLIGVLLAAGIGIAGVHAQTVLGDPRDAARTFASNCSACHKSPRGLAKSGQVAGFLRQHYTTGAEMSAAMAAYLVAAGSAPAEKKGPSTAADGTAAKTKGKKQDQLAAQSPADAAEALQQRTLRGKQRPTKSHDEAAPAHVAPPAEETKQAAAAAVTPAAEPAPVSAPPAQPAPMVLDIPLPPMPDAPPSDLTQSVFASSPLP
ncbi:MAG: hypothetical protein QOH67_580 [Hyphomicrobiales bacterium]|nr:hypothetical protein [Hyphomicrobiales bacterium]